VAAPCPLILRTESRNEDDLGLSEAVEKLHGVGPTALAALCAALDERRLSVRD
jgi:hypothetical protein